jgi:hypothetical protein
MNFLRQISVQKKNLWQTQAPCRFSEIKNFTRKIAEKKSQKADFFPMACASPSLTT